MAGFGTCYAELLLCSILVLATLSSGQDHHQHQQQNHHEDELPSPMAPQESRQSPGAAPPPPRPPGDCHPEAMARCTDPLKVVTGNKDLGFATSIDELDKMCPKLMDGLRCIDDFTYRCLDEEHRNYFNTLYRGTTQVIVDLCQEGEYQTDYLRHAPCMRRVQSGYERCADDYQRRIMHLNRQQQMPQQQQQSGDAAVEGGASSEENVRLLCCSFQRYLHCSEEVVNRTCGHETARFTKGFLDRMSGPLIQGHCRAYERDSHVCQQATAPSSAHDPRNLGNGNDRYQVDDHGGGGARQGYSGLSSGARRTAFGAAILPWMLATTLLASTRLL